MDTVLKRFAQAAVLLALGLLPPAQAQEDDVVREGYFEVRSASTELVDGVVRLDARLQLILSSEALAALESGVPLRIELETEIIRQKRFMPDSTEAELNVRFELEYRPLSERYVVHNLLSVDIITADGERLEHLAQLLQVVRLHRDQGVVVEFPYDWRVR